MSLATELRAFFSGRLLRRTPLADDLRMFRATRRYTPHVHHCPECYAAWPCFYVCAIEHDRALDNGMQAGAHCVCGLCLKRAGLPADTFTTGLDGK